MTKVAQGTALDTATTYTYRIKNLSVGTTPLDTLIKATPADTIVLALWPSTYSVSLEELPEKCTARQGSEEQVVLDERTNTGVARFVLFCNPSLAVTITTVGSGSSHQYVWELRDASGQIRHGLADPTGQVILDGVRPGDYVFHLGFVNSDCVGGTTGGLSQPVTIGPSGGARLSFRIICSAEAARPRITAFHWSYHDGVIAFLATAVDTTRDIASYSFDLTDCAGTSLMPGGPRSRAGLDAGRTQGRDTITILEAYEIGNLNADLASTCAHLRIEDRSGNSTPWVQQPFEITPGSPPVADAFNAVLDGTSSLHTTLSASDPDGDFIGVVIALRLRDGTFGQPDGVPEIVPYNNQGYLGTDIPDAPLGTRIQYTDVYASIVYLIDANGHFTRIEDSDVFQ